MLTLRINVFFSLVAGSLTIFGQQAQGQTTTITGGGLGNSPYSALGIGELFNPVNVTNMGMGGVGISNASVFYLNLQNPALLARRTRFTVFEVGLMGQTKGISQYLNNAEQNQTNTAGNLAYLALAFPANSRWNISLNLRPYSYVNYNILQNINVPGTQYVGQYAYTGQGGLNKVTLASGVRVTKNIYAGAEGSFLFGNITQSSYAQLSGTNTRNDRLERVNYHDVVYKLGLAWRPKISDKYTLNVGATYEPQLRVSGQQTNIYQQIYASGSSTGAAISTPDTIQLNSTGKATLPQQVNFGISLEKGTNIVVGVDVGYQQWSQFRTVENKSVGLKDVMTIAAGAEYSPNPASNRYRDQITYRAGFQINQTPYTAMGAQVKDVNGSLGVSLPLGAYRVNHVTISLVGGQRGVLNGNQIRERYLRIGVGFSLNDWWFRKTVVD